MATLDPGIQKQIDSVVAFSATQMASATSFTDTLNALASQYSVTGTRNQPAFKVGGGNLTTLAAPPVPQAPAQLNTAGVNIQPITLSSAPVAPVMHTPASFTKPAQLATNPVLDTAIPLLNPPKALQTPTLGTQPQSTVVPPSPKAITATLPASGALQKFTPTAPPVVSYAPTAPLAAPTPLAAPAPLITAPTTAGLGTVTYTAPTRTTLVQKALPARNITPITVTAPTVQLPVAPAPLQAALPTAPTVGTVALPNAPAGLTNLPTAPTLQTVTLPSPPTVTPLVFNKPAIPTAPTAPSASIATTAPTAVPITIKGLQALLEQRMVGGTALTPTVERAIWGRELDRENAVVRDTVRELMNRSARRGFMLPQGSLLAQENKLRDATSEKLMTASRDIAIKIAEMEQDSIKTFTSMAFEYEKLQEGNFQWLNDFTLKHSIALADVAVKIYGAQVSSYNFQLETSKLEYLAFANEIKAAEANMRIYEIQMNAAKVGTDMQRAAVDLYNAQLTGVRALGDAYNAQLSASKLQLDMERMKLEMFGSEISAYSATVAAKQGEYGMFTAALGGEQTKVDLYAKQVEAGRAIQQGEVDLFNMDKSAADVRLRQDDLTLKQYESDLQAANDALKASQAVVDTAQKKLDFDVKLYQVAAEYAISGRQASASEYSARVNAYATEAGVQVDNAKLQMEADKLRMSNYTAIMQVNAEQVRTFNQGVLQKAELDSKMYDLQVNAVIKDNANGIKIFETQAAYDRYRLDAFNKTEQIKADFVRMQNESALKQQDADITVFKATIQQKQASNEALIKVFEAASAYDKQRMSVYLTTIQSDHATVKSFNDASLAGFTAQADTVRENNRAQIEQFRMTTEAQLKQLAADITQAKMNNDVIMQGNQTQLAAYQGSIEQYRAQVTLATAQLQADVDTFNANIKERELSNSINTKSLELQADAAKVGAQVAGGVARAAVANTQVVAQIGDTTTKVV